MTTVWIYINTNVPIGDREHVKACADQEAANKWFEQHDPEGVAFEYPVIGPEWSAGLLHDGCHHQRRDQKNRGAGELAAGQGGQLFLCRGASVAFANRLSRDQKLLEKHKKRLCSHPHDQQEAPAVQRAS